MSAPGIKQQTGPLTLLFLFSQYRQITFWFRVETYICVGNSKPFQKFNWIGIFLQYNDLYFKYDVLCLFVLLIVPQRPEISTWWCICNASSLRNSTDNNRACLSPSNARDQYQRVQYSQVSTEIWRIEMYPLTDDQIFSTQRRVTDDHSSSNLVSNSRALHM